MIVLLTPFFNSIKVRPFQLIILCLNSENQLLEDIEWLKILEQGYTVNTVFFEELERGIDTIEDYNYLLENIYKNQ